MIQLKDPEARRERPEIVFPHPLQPGAAGCGGDPDPLLRLVPPGGLTEVLHEVSPIADFSGNLLVEFISYTLSDKPNYPVEECKERDVNYAAPLKVNVRLTNKQTGEVKQTDIFMGEFPLMTETGTFVINGAERVIVSQIVRSPGMYYASDIDKSGKPIFSAQVIPYRGAWLEYETDVNGVMYVRVDKTRKVPITMFIRALVFRDPRGGL